MAPAWIKAKRIPSKQPKTCFERPAIHFHLQMLVFHGCSQAVILSLFRHRPGMTTGVRAHPSHGWRPSSNSNLTWKRSLTEKSSPRLPHPNTSTALNLQVAPEQACDFFSVMMGEVFLLRQIDRAKIQQEQERIKVPPVPWVLLYLGTRAVMSHMDHTPALASQTKRKSPSTSSHQNPGLMPA